MGDEGEDIEPQPLGLKLPPKQEKLGWGTILVVTRPSAEVRLSLQARHFSGLVFVLLFFTIHAR